MKSAGVQTDPVIVPPKPSCRSDLTSSVPDVIQRNNNQRSSDGCARSRSIRRSLQKNCTCDEWEKIWCSKSSSGLIPTLKISRRCSRHCCNSMSSCQLVTQSRQQTLPIESLGTSCQSHSHLVESHSAARRSSHSSECERSDSSRCHYSNVREASVSHTRQWYQTDNRSRYEREMSAKKCGSSSGYDRSRQRSCYSSHSSECERSESNRCRYSTVREVSHDRQWYQTDNRSRCETEMSARKHGGSSGYDRSRQISPSEEHSGNISHAHVAAMNHSLSHSSANITSRKRSWQDPRSRVSASRSKSMRLERSSTRSWQQIARYSQDPAGRPFIVQPLLLPLVPYLPSSFYSAVPWAFPRTFPIVVPFHLLPVSPIPIPLWSWGQRW